MTWTDVSQAWADLWTQVETGWSALYDEAVKIWEGAIRQDPQAYAPKVEAWVAEMDASRQNLDRVKALLPNPPATEADRAAIAQYQALEKRYHELAAAFYADAQPVVAQAPERGATASSASASAPLAAPTPTVGFVPILIAAGLAVGVGATSWAVAAHEYAANLREQTALAARELDARIQASEEGRTLQPTTLPAPPEASLPTTGAGSRNLLLLGGLAVVSAALALPILMNRS